MYNLKMHWLEFRVYWAIAVDAARVAWKEARQYREEYRAEYLD